MTGLRRDPDITLYCQTRYTLPAVAVVPTETCLESIVIFQVWRCPVTETETEKDEISGDYPSLKAKDDNYDHIQGAGRVF